MYPSGPDYQSPRASWWDALSGPSWIWHWARSVFTLWQPLPCTHKARPPTSHLLACSLSVLLGCFFREALVLFFSAGFLGLPVHGPTGLRSLRAAPRRTLGSCHIVNQGLPCFPCWKRVQQHPQHDSGVKKVARWPGHDKGSSFTPCHREDSRLPTCCSEVSGTSFWSLAAGRAPSSFLCTLARASMAGPASGVTSLHSPCVYLWHAFGPGLPGQLAACFQLAQGRPAQMQPGPRATVGR